MNKYMMATKAYVGFISDSDVGDDISRDEPDLCEVGAEDISGKYYVGSWVEGYGFYDVRFPKSTTRELTKEEAEKWVGRRLAINGNMPVGKAFRWEDFGIEAPNGNRIKISDIRWSLRKIGLLKGARSGVTAGETCTGYSREEYLEPGFGVYIENHDNWLLTSPVKSFWQVAGDQDQSDKVVLPSSLSDAAHLDLPELLDEDILFTTKTSLYLMRPWNTKPRRVKKDKPLEDAGFKPLWEQGDRHSAQMMMVASA